MFFSDIRALFLIVGILSVVLGTFFAIRQKRVKRLLIYSSIAQVGFLIVSFHSLNIEGFSSLVFFLIIYLITSILVWGNLVLFYNSASNAGLKYISTFFISGLTGLAKVNPLAALSFVIIFFSISGIPPLSGFLAKFLFSSIY